MLLVVEFYFTLTENVWINEIQEVESSVGEVLGEYWVGVKPGGLDVETNRDRDRERP